MRAILKNRRLEKGFTHQSIANALGISRTTYTNIELGYKNPSLLLAIKIKKLLKYSKDDIFLNSECRKGTSSDSEQNNN
ncbi:helix-turn-helix domain-containing protein [Clostridium sp.]|uniref:helix-turn-helix transcriptional regulator n=1 Tax=Clostridium sp. TaxID=1506 RepID=UPI003216E5FF